MTEAPTAGWAELRTALDRLSGSGHTVEVWWRDDDAVMPTPALERLLALSGRLSMPIAIASVPATATGALSRRLLEEPLVSVLVHGLAHRNHAPAGEKKSEFGADRPLERLAADAAEGLDRARARFAGQLIPVFVPPWNRLADALSLRLAALGYGGLSTFGNRKRAPQALGLIEINTHIDPIDWHGSRGLRPESDIIATLARIVEARRSSPIDAKEPIGLLTHHLVHDEDTWTFCERLLETFASHDAVRPMAANKLFSLALPE